MDHHPPTSIHALLSPGDGGWGAGEERPLSSGGSVEEEANVPDSTSSRADEGAASAPGEAYSLEHLAEESEDGESVRSSDVGPPELVYTLPSFDQAPATPEQVVHYLVSHGFLLSALELLVEAEQTETEQHHRISSLLGPFFDNPLHFPPEAVEECQGREVYKLSAQLQEQEYQLADARGATSFAEYQLRLAQEDVKDLKGRLAKALHLPPKAAAPSQTNGAASEDADVLLDSSEGLYQESDSGSSARVGGNEELNSAIRQYLQTFGYRLSAMTFEDEASGRFNEGGSSDAAVPPGGSTALVAHYKAFQEADNLRAKAADNVALRESLEAAEAQVRELQATIDRMDMEAQCLRGDIAVLEAKLSALQASGPVEGGRGPERGEAAAGAEPPEDSTLQRRQLPAAEDGGTPCSPSFASASASTATAATAEGDGGTARGSAFLWKGGTINAVEALRVVANTLPRVVPSILINARQELLPIFLAVIQEHPDASARCSLSKALFNLIKKPNDVQRKMIIEGCRELAIRIGPQRTMDELLPQCWAQLDDKYPERRVLVAEACGLLSPYISAEVRPSLMLGMLGQLADDSKPVVRTAVASNLARLLPSLDDLSKYQQVEELLFQLCLDVCDEVQEAGLAVLLPALVHRTRASDRVWSSLIPGVLEKMRSVLQASPAVTLGPGSQRGDQEAARSGGGCGGALHIMGPIQQDQLRVLLQMWVMLLPELDEAALAACPSWVDNRALREEELLSRDGSGRGGGEGAGIGADGSVRSAAGTSGAGSSRGVVAWEEAAEGGGVKEEGIPTNPFVEDQAGDASNPFVERAYNPFEDNKAPHTPRPAGGRELTAGGSARSEYSHGDNDSTLDRSGAFLRYGLWAAAQDVDEQGERWRLLHWLLSLGLPKLVGTFRMVHPSDSVLLLRHDFCECMRATCAVFGEAFTALAIVPLLSSAAGAPLGWSPPPHVAEALSSLAPRQSHERHVSRITLLPVLLGGVIPCAGPGALADFLTLILDDHEEHSNSVWALTCRPDMLAVLTFVANIEDMQMAMLRMAHQLVASPTAAQRQFAALLGRALACNLDAKAVERRLLPALTRLTEDKSRVVRLEVVHAVSEVSRRHCAESPGLCSKLQMLLENLIMEGGPQHEVQMAMLTCLGEGTPYASVAQLEFLLQKLLWLLASIAQRQTCGKPPSQLVETAAVVFECLRALDSLDAALLQRHHNLQLHMMSALTCLQREAELLDASRRELLAAMIRDHAASTPAMDVPGEAPVVQTVSSDHRPGAWSDDS
eukprot:CAMPEP_0117657394 /NCGR_PEP_ID=MMETSP0804-20121206/5307_1 /TAXON_ID=1074897 /ORGANISM="Tetraselmis astigmatica, Strain CCMP880" /LENGTH=1274 /DNA_ID=CAMNT_0005463845 /DNA_START=410 /DNA_END=4234 /DNA_ORIENTATION=+